MVERKLRARPLSRGRCGGGGAVNWTHGITFVARELIVTVADAARGIDRWKFILATVADRDPVGKGPVIQ